MQCKGHRFDPWSRKIPHATGQRSLCATNTEAWVLWNVCSATRERPCTATKTQHSQNKKQKTLCLWISSISVHKKLPYSLHSCKIFIVCRLQNPFCQCPIDEYLSSHNFIISYNITMYKYAIHPFTCVRKTYWRTFSSIQSLSRAGDGVRNGMLFLVDCWERGVGAPAVWLRDWKGSGRMECCSLFLKPLFFLMVFIL